MLGPRPQSNDSQPSEKARDSAAAELHMVLDLDDPLDVGEP